MERINNIKETTKENKQERAKHLKVQTRGQEAI
jgi:hypothetical protein